MEMELKRIVIKVGTNVLTTSNGELDESMISRLGQQIAQLKSMGKEVILVSSGAVGVGRSIIQLPQKLNTVTQRQVYASIGQIGLLRKYQETFEKHQLHSAQVLVTKEDFRDREHFINMKRCVLALLRDHIIPIVNENDVISISELMFTDNDELAGLVAALVNADALIIFSNVDGVLHRNGQLIEVVEAGDQSIYEHITSGKSSFGRGGMHTKVRVCQQAAKLGIHTFIANGKTTTPIGIITQKALCTHFTAKPSKPSNLKKWMAHQPAQGTPTVYINEGALQRLTASDHIASLLPVGISGIKGSFKKGDLISICSQAGQSIGLGIAAYGVKKLTPILGKQGEKAFIHYDYLFIYE